MNRMLPGCLGLSLGLWVAGAAGFVFVEARLPPGALPGDGLEALTQTFLIALGGGALGLVLGCLYPGWRRRRRLKALRQRRRRHPANIA